MLSLFNLSIDATVEAAIAFNRLCLPLSLKVLVEIIIFDLLLIIFILFFLIVVMSSPSKSNPKKYFWARIETFLIAFINT